MNQALLQFLNKAVAIPVKSNGGILALEKPCDVLSHPNTDLVASNNALFTCRYSMEHEAYVNPSGEIVAYLLNRLDSPVSGLILVGLNGEVSLSVKSVFRGREVEKKYLALVKGHFVNKNGIWETGLVKVCKNNSVRAISGGPVRAITKYRVLDIFSWQAITLSLVELQLVTGRTHQLRLHCSQNNVPIVGDKTYGDFNFNRKFSKLTGEKRIFLHSNFVEFEYVLQNEKFRFRAQSNCNFVRYCEKVLKKIFCLL